VIELEPFDFELFYPLVPIFVPWTDLMVVSNFQAAQQLSMANHFKILLRDDVQYITVVQVGPRRRCFTSFSLIAIHFSRLRRGYSS
jgi:hypothetical protein